MQDPASFNLDAVKKKVDEMIKNRPVSKKMPTRTLKGVHVTNALPFFFSAQC
jgi:hypothetical protein